MTKYVAILDTETNIAQKGFDIGILIGDTAGNVVLERSWILKEEFSTKLYFEKHRKLYTNRIVDASYPSFYTSVELAFSQIGKILQHYGITEVYAYNAGFDARIMQELAEKYNVINPLANQEIECLWSWACQTFFQQKSFHAFALDNGFVSKAGNFNTSAEVAYSYMKNQPHFEEEHTSLEDCKIEYEIFLYCLRQKKYRLRGIVGNPWILVQTEKQIQKLPKQYRTMQVNLQVKIERAEKLLANLHKDLEIEVMAD